jgi:hypothetical protein
VEITARLLPAEITQRRHLPIRVLLQRRAATHPSLLQANNGCSDWASPESLPTLRWVPVFWEVLLTYF